MRAPPVDQCPRNPTPPSARRTCLDCWGPFSTSSVWKLFQGGCAKVGLSGLRPYDLRHALARSYTPRPAIYARRSSCWGMCPGRRPIATRWLRSQSACKWLWDK